MLAEAEKEEHHAKAFDMSYGWEMHHYFNEIAKGNKNVTDLLELINRENCRFDKAAYRMRFVDNHDENSWNGTIQERMGEAASALTVLSATLPGMPLLYSGNEAGMDKRLKFFEKDPIEWKAHPNRELYKKLFGLKAQTPALFNGNVGGDIEILPQTDEQILVFKRYTDESEVLVFINLSKNTLKKQFGPDVFKAPTYHNYFGNYSMEMNLGWDINFEPWQYEILIAEK
jgi:glycosidase